MNPSDLNGGKMEATLKLERNYLFFPQTIETNTRKSIIKQNKYEIK